MSDNRLRAHAAPGDDDETLRVTAPHIGRFTPAVAEGQLIEPSQILGTLEVLHTRYTLIAPREARGRVQHLNAAARATPVPYDGALLTLELGAEVAAGRAAEASASSEGEPLKASMDGLFYRSPSPEEPVFVQPGDRIEPGDTLGLVEVMKFFYPFVYEGLEPTTLLRFAVEDGTPISAGQIIAWLQP